MFRCKGFIQGELSVTLALWHLNMADSNLSKGNSHLKVTYHGSGKNLTQDSLKKSRSSCLVDINFFFFNFNFKFHPFSSQRFSILSQFTVFSNPWLGKVSQSCDPVIVNLPLCVHCITCTAKCYHHHCLESSNHTFHKHTENKNKLTKMI